MLGMVSSLKSHIWLVEEAAMILTCYCAHSNSDKAIVKHTHTKMGKVKGLTVLSVGKVVE